MAVGHFDQSSIQNVVSDKVASFVQDTLITRAITLPLFRNYSSLLGEGDVKVSIPKLADDFVVNDYSDDCTEEECQNVLILEDEIEATMKKRICWEYTDCAWEDLRGSLKIAILRDAAAKHALAFDKDVFATLLDPTLTAAQDIPLIDDTKGLQYGDILAKKCAMDKCNIPRNERYLFVNPEEECQLLAIDKFICANVNPSASRAVEQAVLGRILGFQVFAHNEIPAGTCLATHRDALGYIFKRSARLEQDKNIKSGCYVNVLSQRYGMKAMCDGKYSVRTPAGVALRNTKK